MKFIKGFGVTIALYLGLSIVFQAVQAVMLETEIVAIFSSTSAISALLYGNLAVPTVTTTYASVIVYIADPTQMALLISILGLILPTAIAVIVGSVVERKSGEVRYVFLSTFAGLLVCAGAGIVIQILEWPTGGVLGYPYWEWFLPSALILSAFNAFFWGSIGLLATTKGWA